LVERRLTEHELEEEITRLNVMRLGQPVTLGCFTVRTLRVSHSIADATALVIDSPGGRVIHTGDFNFDPQPSDGEHTDEAALRHWGDQGVDLLLSDSTNIDVRGEGGSETLVEQELESVIAGCTQRVFVALFASNVQRLIALGRIAERCRRRIVLLGRSLAQHVEVAKDLGYLSWPHQLELPVERLASYPRGEVMVLCSGTQAEPGSAMAKLAADEHRFVRIQPGDRVVFSSRVIPGGERHVSELQDALMRLGATINSRLTHPGIHTSGHACRKEQRRMLELVRPRTFLPVHGTLHHLRAHAALAKECGVASTLVVENGQAAVLRGGYLETGTTFTKGTVSIEWSGVPLGPESLKMRRDLGRYGSLQIGVACDRDWSLSGAPRIVPLGLPQFEDGDTRLGELGAAIEKNWAAFRSRQRDKLERELERFVRRYVDEEFGLRPVVTTQVWGRSN
jgi:ribonuclease J